MSQATITMIAPANNPSQVICRSGASYIPDVNGYAVVNQQDVLDMLNAGWYPVPANGNLGIFGGSLTGAFGGEGNINVQVSAAGVGNGADTTDDTLFTYTLPANSLNAAGKGLLITAGGKLAANGNNKTIKIWVGGQVVWTSGVVTGNAVGWNASAEVIKYGAKDANTQLAQGQGGVNATPAINVPVALTLTENAPIIIKVTGASGTTGAANDVLGQLFQINAMN